MSKPAAVVPLGGGAFRVEREDGSHTIAYAIAEGDRSWVFLDGIAYVLEPSRRERASAAHDAAALSAPMPATVTHIHVHPGQMVSAGDVLVTLEAMKMELPVRATAGGTVRAITCQIGELAQPGMPLVELEPEPRTEPEPEPRRENEA